VAVDEHIYAEQQNQRHQQAGAGDQQFAGGGLFAPEPALLAAREHQADDGGGQEQHGDFAEGIEAAKGDDDGGDNVGRAGIAPCFRHSSGQ